MNWTALSLAQVAGLWLAAGAAALWLYLHSRRPVRRRVSSLRFWVSGHSVPKPHHRLREPWAFLAQLLFLLFVIMALADPRWGDAFESRSVVLVLDTSVWSQTRPAGEPSWIEQERQEAARLLALPAGDRVLILRTDADVTPVWPFTSDRQALRRAIANLRSSSGVADVPRALEMAKAALSGSRRGLIVYVGPAMLDAQQAAGSTRCGRACRRRTAAATGRSFWSAWWAEPRRCRIAASPALRCSGTRQSPSGGTC